MRKVNFLIIMLLALSLIGVMVGCGEATPTPTASPTATPTVTPTATPTATPTVKPTATPTPTPVEPVRIGLLEDATGVIGAYGTAYKRGALVAIKMVNDAGGIKSLGGAKIVGVEGIGDSTVATSVSEVERLINSEKVVALSGPTSASETLACIPLFERYKIPAVTCLQDPTQFEKGYRYVFGIQVSARYIGEQQAEFIDWLAKNHGAPTDSIAVCVLSPAFITKAEGMIDRLAELGYTNIVLKEEFPIGVTDQTPLVMKLKATNPSLVYYVGAAADSVAFHKACYTYDYYPWLVCGFESYGGRFLRDGLPADIAKNTLTRPNIFGAGFGIASDALKDIASVNSFREIYDKAYPGNTDIQGTVALGATKIFTLATALEDAGSRDPEDIADALRKVDIKAPSPYLVFAEAYPRFQMSESGQVTTGLVLAEQWSDDLTEHLLIWPEEFATAEPRIKK